jgi:hypothetical protein
VTAGEVLGLGRTKSFELARRGEFPVKVLRLGYRYVVPTAGLVRLLELEGQELAHRDAENTHPWRFQVVRDSAASRRPA